MLVLLAALVFGLAGGYLAGGRLRNLEGLRVDRAWLVLLALALQVVAFSPAGVALGASVVVVLHLASYALLVWFVLLNRRQFGVVVAGTGIGLNLAPIAANGGYMPASRSALEAAGVAYAGQSSNNSEVIGPGTHLSFLGDVFATPPWVPTANVFSVGDVLIVVGVALILVIAMRGPRKVEATAS